MPSFAEPSDEAHHWDLTNNREYPRMVEAPTKSYDATTGGVADGAGALLIWAHH